MLAIAFEKIFQSVGRMKISMFSMLCGCIANIILDPLLIFGVGFFPEMGIRGAALATGIGQVLTLVIYIMAYLRCELPVNIWQQRSASRLRPERAYIPAILRLLQTKGFLLFLLPALPAKMWRRFTAATI